MKENSRSRLVWVMGVFFLLALLGLLIFRVVRDGIYSNTKGVNILVVGDTEMALLILRPEEDLTGWVRIPEGLKVKIYNSSAQYPVGSLWAYGVSEKDPITITKRSLGLSMGVVIARTIKVNGFPAYETLLRSLRSLGTKTDLSIRDRFLIRQNLVDSIASKKILEMDIPKNALDTVEEPDGKKFVVFNNIISLWTKNKFMLEAILNENAEVSVNNLSGVPGMGIAVSRQLESAGFRVIEVKSDPASDVTGTGCVYKSWGEYPDSENLLMTQFNCVSGSQEVSLENDKRGMEIWLKP